MYATVPQLLTFLREDIALHAVDDEKTGTLYQDDGLSLKPEIEDRLNQAIVNACEEANSYIAMRYALPLAEVPVILSNKVLDIATYNCWARVGINKSTADETVLDRYKQALAWLKLLSEGKVLLQLPSPPDPDEPAPSSTSGMVLLGDSKREKLL